MENDAAAQAVDYQVLCVTAGQSLLHLSEKRCVCPRIHAAGVRGEVIDHLQLLRSRNVCVKKQRPRCSGIDLRGCLALRRKQGTVRIDRRKVRLCTTEVVKEAVVGNINLVIIERANKVIAHITNIAYLEHRSEPDVTLDADVPFVHLRHLNIGPCRIPVQPAAALLFVKSFAGAV